MTSLPSYNNGTPAEWRGYTLREIQMRRTLVQARMEIQKYKLSMATQGVRDKFSGNGNGVMGRVMNIFTYAEYAVMAFKVIRKAVGFFKRSR